MKSPLPVLLSMLLMLALPAAQVRADAPPLTVDFDLQDVDGHRHILSAYRGRWVIVNFWASWCGPCVHEIPELSDYAAAHPDQVLLGINFEKLSAAEARDFARQMDMGYPVLMIGNQPLADFEPLQGLPTTAIVNPEGELVASHTGPVTRAMLEDFMQREAVLRRATAGSGTGDTKKVP